MNCLLCGSFMKKQHESEYSDMDWYWYCTVCGYDLPSDE